MNEFFKEIENHLAIWKMEKEKSKAQINEINKEVPEEEQDFISTLMKSFQ